MYNIMHASIHPILVHRVNKRLRRKPEKEREKERVLHATTSELGNSIHSEDKVVRLGRE